MTPGETVYGEGTIVLVEGRPLTAIRVDNTGDRPVQVGSHFHFAEANPALVFDRAATRGKDWPCRRARACVSSPALPSMSNSSRSPGPATSPASGER